MDSFDDQSDLFLVGNLLFGQKQSNQVRRSDLIDQTKFFVYFSIILNLYRLNLKSVKTEDICRFYSGFKRINFYKTIPLSFCLSSSTQNSQKKNEIC